MAEQLTGADAQVINPDLYLRHQRDLDRHTVAKDGNVSRIRKTRREMKADGVNLEAFNLVRKLAKFDDEDRILILETARRYAGWEKIEMPPMWRAGNNEQPQGGMFEDEPSPEAQKAHHDNRVAMDAWNSRKAGGARENNPHPAASEDNQTWDAAWRKADKDLKDTVPLAAKKAPRAEAPPPGYDDGGGPRDEPEVAAAKAKGTGGRGRPKGSKNKAKGALAALASGRKRVNGPHA